MTGILTFKDASGKKTQLHPETSADCLIFDSDSARNLRHTLGIYKNIIFDECENNWQVQGTPEISNGEIILDGSSYAQTVKPITLGGANPFTVEVITKSDGQLSVNIPPIYFYRSDNHRFGIFQKNGSVNPWFYVRNNSNLEVDYVDTDTDLTSTYYNLTLTYDGTNFYSFVDGILKNTTACNLLERPFYIIVGANVVGGNYFEGRIKEFKLSNVCKATTNFTPANSFEKDNYTLSLLHFD